jgi:F-type H+-transporting ATPase subunit delta
MKKRTPQQYADALWEITDGLDGKERSSVLRAFVLLLKKDRALSSIERIADAFEKKIKKEKGVVALDVTFAQKQKESFLETIEEAFGGKVEMKTAVDKSIVGGVIIKTEDTILDASIKTRLASLKHILTT